MLEEFDTRKRNSNVGLLLYTKKRELGMHCNWDIVGVFCSPCYSRIRDRKTSSERILKPV